MKTQSRELVKWYQQNARDLPWRTSKDPYRIWISEVMLQQTTVKAVIPFYEKFLQRFPTVHILASSSLEEVYGYWTGLGYYSRARNLHKAAIQIALNGFPKNYKELLELPGFGPYTARAVSSFSFSEQVGVLDGNVIRFLCRFHYLKIPWWESSYKNQLQEFADQWVKNTDSSICNQALIEIGATLCTPQNPSCLLCPVRKSCGLFAKITSQKDSPENVPLKKPRKKKEIWLWEPYLYQKGSKHAYTINDYTPFLKGQLLFPGTAKQLKTPPQKYDYKHNITHHEIYVKLIKTKTEKPHRGLNLKWYSNKEITQKHPVTLIQKALKLSSLESS